MKNALYSENRVKVAEQIRKNLKEVFNENFLQKEVTINNRELLIKYKSNSFLITVNIEEM